MDHMNHDHHMEHMEVTTTMASIVAEHNHNHHEIHDMVGTTAESIDNSEHISHQMDHSMKMYFHSDIGNDYVFFKHWKPSTPGEMIWTCIAIFVLGVTYEGLKYYRDYLLKSWRITTYYVSDTPNGIRTNGLSNNAIPGRDNKQEIRRRMLSYSHLFQTVLHMLQFFISYLLMLVFMTYNVYLCISVLFGAGVGYFLFGWYKSSAVDITEHCH